MFLNSEYEIIKRAYDSRLKGRSKKVFKIWSICFTSFIALVGILFLFVPKILEKDPFMYIIPIYGGMILVILIIGILVSKYGISEKPTFEYLYPEIYKKINFDEGLFLEYVSYEKIKKTFNKEGGLFNRFANVATKRHIKGYSSNQIEFDIFDTVLTTSSGKSQTVHFNGIYYIIKVNTNSYLQVRTKSSPKLKGVKFDRQKEIEDIRVFTETERQLLNTDYQYINFIKKLLAYDVYKHIELSIIPNEVHLALTYRKHPVRKQKDLTFEKVNWIMSHFKDELNLVESLTSINKIV